MLWKLVFRDKYNELMTRLDYLDARVYDLEYGMLKLKKRGEAQVKKIEDLKAAVEAETEVVASVVVLLDELSKVIADSKIDEAELAAVIDAVNANKEVLAAAVVANTPDAGGSTGGIVG